MGNTSYKALMDWYRDINHRLFSGLKLTKMEINVWARHRGMEEYFWRKSIKEWMDRDDEDQVHFEDDN